MSLDAEAIARMVGFHHNGEWTIDEVKFKEAVGIAHIKGVDMGRAVLQTELDLTRLNLDRAMAIIDEYRRVEDDGK